LKGAFPPLKGSKIVLDDDPEIMIDIIMNGYSGRAAEGFGIMPPVGTTNNLSAEEITAIMNHEKTSWGNDAKTINADEVNKIIEFIKQKQTSEKK
jgi:cytochrome c oxidase cbb3-type subunit 2